MTSLRTSFVFTITAILIALSDLRMALAQEHGEGADGHVADAAAHGKPGLPQLDASTYPSQLFWLAVTGIVLYLLMSKVALPRIERIMRERDAFVHDNLHKTAVLRDEAEDAKINYDRTVRQAENNAKEFLANTVADMRQKHDVALQAALQKVSAELAQTEARLQADKDQIMGSLDGHATKLADEIMLHVFETKPTTL